MSLRYLLSSYIEKIYLVNTSFQRSNSKLCQILFTIDTLHSHRWTLSAREGQEGSGAESRQRGRKPLLGPSAPGKRPRAEDRHWQVMLPELHNRTESGAGTGEEPGSRENAHISGRQSLRGRAVQSLHLIYKGSYTWGRLCFSRCLEHKVQFSSGYTMNKTTSTDVLGSDICLPHNT